MSVEPDRNGAENIALCQVDGDPKKVCKKFDKI